MNAAERRRRIRAGRPQLIADIGLLRLRGFLSPTFMRDVTDPHMKFAQFQALRRHISTLLRCNL
jgi:hypothetical protein